MEIDDYKPNSFKYREAMAKQDQTPETKKIAQGTTVSKKQSTSKKLKDEIFKTDIHDVIDYLTFDVAIPAAKRFLSEAGSSAIDMMLGIDTRRNRGNGSKISYTRFYDERRDDNRRDYSSRSRRDVYDYNEISFQSKGDAIDVLDEMIAQINEYGSVTVGKYYTMSGQPTMSTDFNYGWTTLRSAEVVRNRDGSYSIDLPRIIPL